MEGFTFKENTSVLGKPAVFETFLDLVVCMVPIWVAVAIGLIIGWSWKPRWASFLVFGLRSRTRLAWSTPPGFGARRIWLAMTAITAIPVLRDIWGKFCAWKWPQKEEQLEQREITFEKQTIEPALNGDDLKQFLLMLEGRDGGLSWQMMMDKSIPGMTYQAWRREPQDGPTQYRSRTVYEDIRPEVVKDFFWDDEFRPEWDDMLLSSKTLDECRNSGYMTVHWVRKFPFFCKDREYIIGRRIWQMGNTFYCITKGVQNTSVPRVNSPRRVDLFFSSFRIRPVESPRDGSLTACEVMLFHYEDMGIPKALARSGVQLGMWGLVKKIEPGVRKYEAVQKTLKPLSNSAQMAKITTKVPAAILRELGISSESTAEAALEEKKENGGLWKWVVLGSAVALACGVDRGAVSKVVLFGIARRLGRLGRRL